MTLMELMVAAGITVSVTGAISTLANPAYGVLDAQPEAADLQQRLRLVAGTLTTALMPAQMVRPSRAGQLRPDPPGTARTDAIAVTSEGETATYYLKADSRADVYALMRDDGDATDLPVVDHVVMLAFEYFGGPVEQAPVPLDPATVAAGGGPVRLVRVSVRVEAAAASLRGPAGPLFHRPGTSTSPQRSIPDQEVQFDVALRGIR